MCSYLKFSFQATLGSQLYQPVKVFKVTDHKFTLKTTFKIGVGKAPLKVVPSDGHDHDRSDYGGHDRGVG